MITQYIVLALYFLILGLIGYASSRKVKGVSDYYVGGKDLNYWIAALSARATGESGWLLLGLTGMGAMMGLKAFWVVLGEVLGVAGAWLFMAKPFKKQTDKWNSITIPDYLVSRFRSKTNRLRIFAATVLTVFITIYVSSQIDATGSAFEAFFGWNYFVGALVGFAVVVGYIMFGGFLAVAWSDFFQGAMMFFGLVFLPIVGYFALNSVPEFPGLMPALHQMDPNLTSFLGEGGFSLLNIASIIGFLVLGIGFLGSPQIFVRFMSIKNVASINKGTKVAIVFTIITDSAAVLAGMMGRLLLTNNTDSASEVLGNGAQNVLPMMVDNLFSPLLIAIFVSIVLSAILSTVDSLLMVASSSISTDIYQKVLNPKDPEKHMLKISRWTTLILSLMALVVSLIVAAVSPTRTIFWFVMFGWSGLAATFCPVMILSLSWNKYTEKGAIASMIVGFFGVPIFKFLAPALPSIGAYFVEIDALAPSFLLSMLAGTLVSLMEPDKTLESTHKEVRVQLRQERKAELVTAR